MWKPVNVLKRSVLSCKNPVCTGTDKTLKRLGKFSKMFSILDCNNICIRIYINKWMQIETKKSQIYLFCVFRSLELLGQFSSFMVFNHNPVEMQRTLWTNAITLLDLWDKLHTWANFVLISKSFLC